MDQMDTGEETEYKKYIRMSMPLPDIPSLQKHEQKNRESILTAAGEKAENWLSFRNINIFHQTQHK